MLDNRIPDSPNILQGVTGVAIDQHSKHAGYTSTVHKQFQTKATHCSLYPKIFKYKIHSERGEYSSDSSPKNISHNIYPFKSRRKDVALYTQFSKNSQ